MKRYKQADSGALYPLTEEDHDYESAPWVAFRDHQYALIKQRVVAEDMLAILERLEQWGCTEDKMFTQTREKTLFKLINDAQTVLYRARHFLESP